MPGSYGQHTLSRLYLDGVPMEDLQALYEANTDLLGAEGWNSPNRFWATPPRDEDSRVREVMEVSLNTEKWVNHFSFRISRFPCRWWLQWWNEDVREWRDCRYKRGRKQYQDGIQHSVPARVPEDVVNHRHRHPQHIGQGHWEYIDTDIRPVKARRFRLVLVRMRQGKPPRNRHGKKVDYSLAVQDFQLGYRVKSPKDVPRRKVRTQVDDLTEDFSSSTDLLGSPVSFSLREYKASDILWPSRQALRGVRKADREHNEAVWKCEPQPLSYAVVNLYVDARDGNGDPQSIDRFWVDPLTPGVWCNLYYSNDMLSEDFAASDEPLRYPATQGHGEVRIGNEGLLFDRSSTGYVDVDNTVVQWRVNRPWWVGMIIQPQFDSADTGEYTLLDSAGCRVRWRDQALRITVGKTTLVNSEMEFDPNRRMTLVIAYDGDRIRASMPGWSADAEAPGDFGPRAMSKELNKYLRFGGALSSSEGQGGFRLRGFVLKRETTTDTDALLESFRADPDAYLVRPDIDSDDTDQTHNARLRYHPYYQTWGQRSLNPYGFVGGPGLAYEDVEWTPINRDFRLHKGYMQFDPVRAKYFKFEFTNLTPEPYTPVTALSRKTKLFTADTAERSLRQHRSLGGGSRALGGSGNAVNQALGAQVSYSDMLRLITRTNPERRYEEYTPTEAMFARDPQAAARLRKVSPIYNFQPWHKSGWAPRFVDRQKHYYETVEIEHKDKVAYFVGLKGLRMFQVDYTGTDDTEQYLYHFREAPQQDYDPDTDTWTIGGRMGLDDENDPFPWSTASDGGLVTPGAMQGSVQTTSKVLRSRRNVRAVQFATQQSPARQLLRDPDFNDSGLQTWRVYQGATIEASEDLGTDIGTTVKVTRVNTGGFWNFQESRWADWAAIEEAGTTWDDMEGSDDVRSEGGIESTEMIQPSEGGRLYAAGRVYAPGSLGGTLHLQLVAESGEVLSDQPMTVSAGRMAEWYASYTIGEGGTESALYTWDEIEDEVVTWDGAEQQGTWLDFDQTQRSLTGPVFVRLYQDSATEDVFYVDNLSLFEDAIVWEFSNDDGQNWWPVYDIRNNPHGVFTFPDLTPETHEQTEGTNLRWRVRGYRPDAVVSALAIRPWYSSIGLGVPYRETIEGGGPNITPYDQYPAIEDHPLWKLWAKPIPQEWYFIHRQWLLQQHEVPPVPDKIVVPEAIVPGDTGRPPISVGPYLLEALVFEQTQAYLPDGFIV